MSIKPHHTHWSEWMSHTKFTYVFVCLLFTLFIYLVINSNFYYLFIISAYKLFVSVKISIFPLKIFLLFSVYVRMFEMDTKNNTLTEFSWNFKILANSFLMNSKWKKVFLACSHDRSNAYYIIFAQMIIILEYKCCRYK